MKNYRIIFMGTPEISAFVLQALIENNYNIVGVIAQPDKPVGRKKILEPVPTKVVANKYNIPVFQPLKIKHDYEFVNDLKPDVIVTLAYGQIVPQGLLDIPTHGCVNLHGSLLPKYRGAAPIQYAIKDGLTKTGMTLMQMIDKMDAGLMYAKKECDITPEDNTTSLFKKMAVVARDLILETLDDYMNGSLIGIEQNENEVSFCPTIKKEEEKIPLDLNCKDFVNYVRALADIPGGYVYFKNYKLKIFKAEVANNQLGEVGKIVQADKNGLLLQLNDGQVKILEVQKEGKNRIDYKSFINGENDLNGLKFQ
ncbi:MAG: methionyl-tRNA formyltransferase [Bacilli bacterium]|nr:methionyl-tRNA formyltransferase [Bacilli bacterium]